MRAMTERTGRTSMRVALQTLLLAAVASPTLGFLAAAPAPRAATLPLSAAARHPRRAAPLRRAPLDHLTPDGEDGVRRKRTLARGTAESSLRMADARVDFLVTPTPEEALAAPAPEVGKVRADALITWLWETAQFRPDYPECSIDYFADTIVYEDMVYKEPFVGKDSVSKMLAEVKAMAPEDFIFVMDRCSDGATSCGFTWHIELGTRPEAGKFANGMSFYELDADGKICYVRDLVEPSIKTGSFGIRLASVIGKAIGKAPPPTS